MNIKQKQQLPVILLVTASSSSPLAMTSCVPALPAIGVEFDLPVVASVVLSALAYLLPVNGNQKQIGDGLKSVP